MRAVLNYAYVAPAGAIAVVEMPEPSMPWGSELLVSMDFSHISHDDLQFLSGQRSPLPALPCVPGSWGVGTIQAVGCAAGHFKIGDRVLLPRNRLTWAERLVVSSDEVVALGSGHDFLELLNQVTQSATYLGCWGEGADRVGPCGELMKLLTAPHADAQLKSQPATVFPLWQINEAIACSLDGFHVLLCISKPSAMRS